MSEQKKAPAPSLFDNAQPRTSIKVLQQNQRDYIARNKVWGIAIISFFMGCVLATTGTWFLMPRSNSSLDQTIPFDSSPALTSVEPDNTLSSHSTPPEIVAAVESKLDTKTALNNQKNPLAVFNEEQATKATTPANPSNPFKVLEKDSSTAKVKKPATKQPEKSVKNRSTEQSNTKKDKTVAAETKKESESNKQQNSTQKNLKNKKETSVATTNQKNTETKQPPKKQPTKPDAIEELIKKL